MQAERRARLSKAQKELVRALRGQGPPPAGFDRSRIGAAADALMSKRAHAVESSWPLLARSLGESFIERFVSFAEESPIPLKGGPLADGRLFAEALEKKGCFPLEARLEKLAFDARYARVPDGYKPRCALSIKAMLMKRPLRLVVVVRLPWLGERWLISSG